MRIVDRVDSKANIQGFNRPSGWARARTEIAHVCAACRRAIPIGSVARFEWRPGAAAVVHDGEVLP